MTNHETEQFLQDYYASWGTLDPSNVVAFFCEDAVFEDLAFQARFDGLDAIRAFAELTYAGAPDFRVDPVYVVVGDESAAAEWVMSGTHSGDLPGLPATNRPFEVRASSVLRFREDRISQIVDYWNLDSFRASVGAGPSAPR